MSAIAINPVHRAVRFYEAPIGKKAVMAVTGVILFGYVVAHLLGNLQIFAGPEQINRYAAFLHNPANAGLLWAARLVLLAAVVLHIVASMQLWKLKRDARPVAYVKKDDPAASYASRTMMWSGPIVAAFVIFHILHLTVGAVVPLQEIGPNEPDVRANVIAGFSNPLISGLLHPGHDPAVHAPVPRPVEHVPEAGPQPPAVHADVEERRGDRRHADRHRQHLDSRSR